MNWRGILGLYAGFAVVMGGVWLWVRTGNNWALGVPAAGVVLTIVSVVLIVVAQRPRKMPEQAKVPKRSKDKTDKVTVVVDDDDEADTIARTRLAVIAERSSRQEIDIEPIAPLPLPEREIETPDEPRQAA